ncbi:WD40-repeat-containing domain protein [Absidia repens]|uniref:WD40-repeat-containing domain protein n=1 Tax=Absidia repens TaxID=90262 RepID=A0A1X2HZI4_9FUNG|nr:WD40-repeat-containing domain protein [Absidia repens]
MIKMNLSTLFNSNVSQSPIDESIPTYIAILNKKDGTTTTKCLNPSRRRSSISSFSYPLKKRLVGHSNFFLPKLRHQSNDSSTQPNCHDSLVSQKDFKYHLPLEVILRIVNFLDYGSILALSRTSRYYYRLCQDDHIWHALFSQDFHRPSTKSLQQQQQKQLFRNHCTLSRRWINGQISTQYLHGHQDSVYCMARLGHHQLVSGGRDRTLILWDLNTKQQQSTHGNGATMDRAMMMTRTKRTAHEGSILCLRVSQDGKTMLSGSSDATCILWCLQTLQPLQTLRGHGHGVLDVCMVGTNYYVSASRDNTLCVWDATTSSSASGEPSRTGKRLHQLHGHLGPVNALDAYGDEHVISASGDGTLKLWNVRTGKCIRTFEQDGSGNDDNDTDTDTDNEQQQQQQQHRGLACVNCDGKRGLVYSGGQNGKLKIWDITNGECLATLSGHHGLIRTMDLMEDGKTLVTGGYQTIRVYDVQKRQCLLSFHNHHSSWIFNLLVTRSRIISAGQGKQILMLDFGHSLSPLDDGHSQ